MNDALRTAVTLSPTPIAICDATGRLVLANPAMAILLGLSDADATGHQLERSCLDAADGTGFWEGRGTLGTVAGTSVWCDMRIQRCPDDGEVRYAVACLPGALVQEKRLRRLLEMSRPYVALGRLMLGYAHDLMNTFQIVLGHGELLRNRMTGNDSKTTASIRYIVAAAEDGIVAGETLRALSRKHRPPRSVCRLTILVREALADRIALPAGIKVRLHLDDPGPAVLAEELAIRCILEELLDNAVAAMPDGGVLDLRTGILQRGKGKSWAEIQVVDSGPGIPAEVIQALSGDATVDSPHRAIRPGMGLTVTNQILRDFGGRLEISALPGRGSTVRCLLPMAPSTIAQPTVPGAS